MTEKRINALRISGCQKGTTNKEKGKARISPVVLVWKWKNQCDLVASRRHRYRDRNRHKCVR